MKTRNYYAAQENCQQKCKHKRYQTKKILVKIINKNNKKRKWLSDFHRD